MKAVQIINTLAVADGGPARNAFELNRALNEHLDVEVRLFWIKGNSEDSVAHGVPDHPFQPWQVIRSLSTAREDLKQFLRHLRDAEFVIIHGYYLPWIPVVASASRALGAPFVMAPHGSLTVYQQQHSRVRKAAFDVLPGALARILARGFVTGSPVEAEELKTRFASARVGVAGVGTRMPAQSSQKAEWSAPLRLLSMSRIAPKKRIDLSIQTVAELARQGMEATLTVAGTGDRQLKETLQQLAVSEGVSDRVEFVGQRSGEEKTREFLEADLFLLPSDDENFGIGVAEAAAHGLPIIASTGVAAARFITEAAGRVLESPTASTLAQAVRDYVSLNTAAAAHAHTRELAEQVYSWRSAALAWGKALNSLGIAVTPR